MINLIFDTKIISVRFKDGIKYGNFQSGKRVLNKKSCNNYIYKTLTRHSGIFVVNKKDMLNKMLSRRCKIQKLYALISRHVARFTTPSEVKLRS